LHDADVAGLRTVGVNLGSQRAIDVRVTLESRQHQTESAKGGQRFRQGMRPQDQLTTFVPNGYSRSPTTSRHARRWQFLFAKRNLITELHAAAPSADTFVLRLTGEASRAAAQRATGPWSRTSGGDSSH